MTRCRNCGDNWNVRATLKRYTTSTPGMPCPSCGEVQYLSREYRERSMLVTLLIPLLMLIPAFFNIPVVAMAILFVAAFTAIAVIHLSTIELADEQETWRQRLYE